METPGRINFFAQRLHQGYRVNRMTVRDFLHLFGAERRGAVKVQGIRTILDSLDLETEPDFETAWIDGPMWLRLRPGVAISSGSPIDPQDGPAVANEIEMDDASSDLPQDGEATDRTPVSEAPETVANEAGPKSSLPDDPTFRIGRLPAANKDLISVNQNDTLKKAISLLLRHDFSQLPVMHGDREVKGVVTWKSIGSKLALGCRCEHVGDCSEDTRIIDSNRTLFDAIPTIVEYGYVLVRDQRDRRITGIVTASDLSLEFQTQSEPFLLLREIELHVRQLLSEKISAIDFEILDSPTAPSQRPESLSGLSFGQYVRLIQHPTVWSKLQLSIDSGVLTKLLEEVRIIRNDVMHFDPDPMTPEELRKLKQAARFMQELYELLP
jgi:CBS domain-containing protein